jgi:hypothetical protein
MAKYDVKLLEPKNVSTREFYVEDRTTSSASATIKAGEPCKIRGAEGGNDVIILATGDPEIGTDLFAGIAQAESTETSTADGAVNLFIPVPGITVMRCAATTPANVDTAAERLGVLYDSVCFDLTTGTFTVDENEGADDNVHGLSILDVNIDNGDIDFAVRSQVCFWGSAV